MSFDTFTQVDNIPVSIGVWTDVLYLLHDDMFANANVSKRSWIIYYGLRVAYSYCNKHLEVYLFPFECTNCEDMKVNFVLFLIPFYSFLPNLD